MTPETPPQSRPSVAIRLIRTLFFSLVVLVSVFNPIADFIISIILPMQRSEAAGKNIQDQLRLHSEILATLPATETPVKLNGKIVHCPFTHSDFLWRKPPTLAPEIGSPPQFFAWSRKIRWHRRFLIFADSMILVSNKDIDWENQTLYSLSKAKRTP